MDLHTSKDIAIEKALIESVLSEANAFDEDTNFTDYIKCITGVELSKQIYYLQKLKTNLTKKLATISNTMSPAHFGAMIGNFGPARVLDLFLPGTQLR
jgi:hypothetical protein